MNLPPPPPPPVAHPQDFVPPFSNFVPPLECGWRHTGNVQGGVLVNVQEGGGVFSNFSEGGWRHADNVQGGLPVNVQEWGHFSNWWRHADNVQGGGAPGVPPIQVQTPPHTHTWLAGYGPDKEGDLLFIITATISYISRGGPIGILRGEGVLDRNSSSGGVQGQGPREFSYTDKQTKNLGGGLNPPNPPPPPRIRHWYQSMQI